MKVKKILVSQPKPATEKSPYFDLESKYGVQIDFRPFIRVEGVTTKEFRAQKVDILDHTAMVFTARTAVDNFFRICGEMKITIPETLDYNDTFNNTFNTYLKENENIGVKTTGMGSMYKLSFKIKMKDMNKEKEMIDAIRVLNGNLEIQILPFEANNENL